ncbi:acyl-CoA thioesterase [Thalassobacillus cyri]|uniref:Acyl-CoA thioesterase n=1 Tax=Thalassobacillus cyri TaxID=571932 RepID=A0A1H4E7G1_9BACI|nr:PaaI family thioesterase [Thalassobacillus cyri]SEA80500.1 acyl-CoA thioesterase [Thalassobacillus cyri]
MISEIQKDFNASPFGTRLGMEIAALEEGKVQIRTPIESHLHNTIGTVHGGVYASILDTTMGILIRSIVKKPAITIHLDVNFFLPVTKGVLISEGSIIKQGKKIIVAEASITNENGDLLAKGSGTFQRKESKKNSLT